MEWKMGEHTDALQRLRNGVVKKRRELVVKSAGASSLTATYFEELLLADTIIAAIDRAIEDEDKLEPSDMQARSIG
jgi:hypothetical protein